MRHALILAAGLWAGSARPVVAQHCHASAPDLSRAIGVRVGLHSEFASYQTTRYEGEYQGVGFDAGWQSRWIRARASWVTYRLTRNGLEDVGMGDLLLDLRVPIMRTTDDALIAGIGMASTLPTGDSSRDLGMGHIMLMPGIWAAWQTHLAFISTQAAYGRALSSGGGAHHHGGGAGPIVNPMNASEIEVSFAAGYNVHERVRVRGGAYGAVPIGADSGTSRAVAFAGIDVLVTDWLELSLQQHLPIAGHPFLAKIVLQAAAYF